MSRTFDQMAAEAFAQVPTISPEDAHRLRQGDPRTLIIDVQDAADIAAVGIISGARAISLGSLTYKADHSLPEEWRDPDLNDHGRSIITTCYMGPMGALGGKLLSDMGFTKVRILEGGVQAWMEAGYEIEPFTP